MHLCVFIIAYFIIYTYAYFQGGKVLSNDEIDEIDEQELLNIKKNQEYIEKNDKNKMKKMKKMKNNQEGLSIDIKNNPVINSENFDSSKTGYSETERSEEGERILTRRKERTPRPRNDLMGAAWVAEVLASDENEEGLVMMYSEVRV